MFGTDDIHIEQVFFFFQKKKIDIEQTRRKQKGTLRSMLHA